MKTAGKKAFTLVELLMVILIISILAMLVVPSVIRAVELARQAACNTNIQAISKALKGYSTAHGKMPYVPVSSWNVRIGTNRDINPFVTGAALKDRNHSANLWLLAREDYVASLSAFICPATTDIPSDRQEAELNWDFSSSRYISYGLQSPYGWDGSLSIVDPIEGGGNVVQIADGSPYVETSTGDNPGKIDTERSVVDWGDDNVGAEAKQLLGNSPNHGAEGQNVGYRDGRVEWKTVANCGKGGDNIYTATNARTGISAAGSLLAGIKNNENDTLILP